MRVISVLSFGSSSALRSDLSPRLWRYLVPALAFCLLSGCSGSGDGMSPVEGLATPQLETIAGTGVEGMGEVGKPGPETALANPSGLGVDSEGRVLIADFKNHRVLRLSPAGTVELVAGTGRRGFSGDEGPATVAELSFPCGVSGDRDGGVLIADTNNQRIRRVDGKGIIRTLVAELSFPEGVEPDGRGGIYIAEAGGHRVRHWSPENGLVTVLDSDLISPYDLALHPDGRLIIADYGGHRIVAVDLASGAHVVIAGTGVRGFSGDEGPATLAQLAGPQGVEVAPDGSIWVADTGNHRVRVIRRDGTITSVISAGLQGPDQLAFRSDGTLFVADTGHQMIRLVVGELPLERFFGDYRVVEARGIFEGREITSGPAGVVVEDGRRLGIRGTLSFRADRSYLADLELTEDGELNWLSRAGFTRFEGRFGVDGGRLELTIPLWGVTKTFHWSEEPASARLILEDATPEGEVPLIHGDLSRIVLERVP